MSGTSLDGLDLAIVHINCESGKIQYKLSKSVTIKYSEYWEHRLKSGRFISGEELTLLNVEYGRYIGEEINKFIDEPVDLISSHGHTVFHQPQLGVTVQIGSLNEIAALTKIKTVGDFRTLDVAKGGQGAPLVPIGDEYLFGEYDYCINLGGISNISSTNNNVRSASDLSACNIVSNQLVAEKGMSFDPSGEIGSRGQINQGLFDKLASWSYYSSQQTSLGIEQVEQEFLPLLAGVDISIEDKLRTYYEHLGVVIGSRIQEGNALFTGGGVKNLFLIKCIERHAKANIVIPSDELIDFKEALIFSLLGFLRVNAMPNVLASVTGASSDSSSGVVVLP